MPRDLRDSNCLGYLGYPDYPGISLSSCSPEGLYTDYRFARATLSSYLIRLRRLSSLLFA